MSMGMAEKNEEIRGGFEALHNALVAALRHSADDSEIDRLAQQVAAVAKLEVAWMNGEKPS